MAIDDTANDLVQRQTDPFAAVRDLAIEEAGRHERTSDVASYQGAREVSTLIAAARASYVLVGNSGFGYLPLHIVATFGHTGQVDLVETSPAVAAFVEQVARQQSVGDRVRVYLGSPANVVSSLNGPYDVVLLDSVRDGAGPRFEDVVRLTRIGGAIIVVNGTAGGDSGAEFLEAIATDPRLLASFPADLSPVVAVRRR